MAYLPNGRVLGLSKFARVAHKHASRPQVQERLVTGVADEIMAVTGCDDVAVMAEGVHLCMQMRGIKTPGTMRSCAWRGRFEVEPELRRDAFSGG